MGFESPRPISFIRFLVCSFQMESFAILSNIRTRRPLLQVILELPILKELSSYYCRYALILHCFFNFFRIS